MALREIARELAFESLAYAQANISGHKVGACVVASRKDSTKYFTGANIELAVSMCFHAERVALIKAISEGYTHIEEVYVTSSSLEQRAALCGYCRQDFMYVNPYTVIYVFNPDHTLKIEVQVISTLNHPYLSGESNIKEV